MNFIEKFNKYKFKYNNLLKFLKGGTNLNDYSIEISLTNGKQVIIKGSETIYNLNEDTNELQINRINLDNPVFTYFIQNFSIDDIEKILIDIQKLQNKLDRDPNFNFFDDYELNFFNHIDVNYKFSELIKHYLKIYSYCNYLGIVYIDNFIINIFNQRYSYDNIRTYKPLYKEIINIFEQVKYLTNNNFRFYKNELLFSEIVKNSIPIKYLNFISFNNYQVSSYDELKNNILIEEEYFKELPKSDKRKYNQKFIELNDRFFNVKKILIYYFFEIIGITDISIDPDRNSQFLNYFIKNIPNIAENSEDRKIMLNLITIILFDKAKNKNNFNKYLHRLLKDKGIKDSYLRNIRM
jgi:hypothetical protein